VAITVVDGRPTGEEFQGVVRVQDIRSVRSEREGGREKCARGRKGEADLFRSLPLLSDLPWLAGSPRETSFEWWTRSGWEILSGLLW